MGCCCVVVLLGVGRLFKLVRGGSLAKVCKGCERGAVGKGRLRRRNCDAPCLGASLWVGSTVGGCGVVWSFGVAVLCLRCVCFWLRCRVLIVGVVCCSVLF